jgi:hypothetical protein
VFSVRYELEDTKTLHSAHTEYLCVPYDSHSKQRLLSLKSINRLVIVIEPGCVSCEVRAEFLNTVFSGHRTRRFPGGKAAKA